MEIAALEGLTLDKLSTGYGSRLVTRDISWHIPYGRLVSLLGANGSGKSTLLKAIALGSEALSGRVCIDGTDLSRKTLQERARTVAVVLNDVEYERRLTVEELVAIGRIPYTGFMGSLQHEDRTAIHNALLQCGLKGYERRRLGTLSDGERQRAFVARAFAQQTPLVLLDEPTAHLDLAHRMALYRLLRDMAHRSQRIVLVSCHELQLAVNTSDEIGILTHEGELIHGIPEELALQNAYEKLFPGEHFTFDPVRGIVEEEPTMGRFVQVEGSGEQKALIPYAEAMLRRLGYRVTSAGQEPELRLVIGENQWTLDTDGRKESYPSLTALAERLQRITIR